MQQSEEGNESETDAMKVIAVSKLDEMLALQLEMQENENIAQISIESKRSGEEQTKQQIVRQFNEAFVNGKSEFNSEWLIRNVGDVSIDLMQEIVELLQEEYDVQTQGSSSGRIMNITLKKQLSKKRSLQEIDRSTDTEEDENIDIKEDPNKMYIIRRSELELMNADRREEVRRMLLKCCLCVLYSI